MSSSGLRITPEPFWNVAVSENGPRVSGMLPSSPREDLIIPLWSTKRWGIAQGAGGTSTNTNAMTFFADFIGQHFTPQGATVNWTGGSATLMAGQYITGSSTSGTIIGWGGTGYLGSPIMPLHNPKTIAALRVIGITDIRMWYGICENILASTICAGDAPIAKYALFRFSSAIDTTLQAVVCDGTDVTVVDTGITFTAEDLKLGIDVDQNGGRYLFYINGALVATISNDLPAVDTIMYSFFRLINTAAVAKTIVFNYVYQESDI